MGCLAFTELFEFGLSVEFPLVYANVGAANVIVACLVVGSMRVVVKWKFDVDCWCLLCARKGVGVRCDVVLQKELLPMLVTLRGVGEVKDAGEMEKAVGKDEVVFVNRWVVMYEVFQASGCGVNVPVKLLVLGCWELCGMELVC